MADGPESVEGTVPGVGGARLCSFLLLTCLVRAGVAAPHEALTLGSLSKALYGEEQLWDALAAAHVGPQRRTALMAAARRGDAARVRFLLARNARVNARTDLSPAKRVAARGMNPRLYAQHGIPGISTALTLASASLARVEAVNCSTHPSSAEARGRLLDERAALTATIEALRAAGARPLEELEALDCALLVVASAPVPSAASSAARVRALVADGADVAARPGLGEVSPLHAAAHFGRDDLVVELLRPLHAAACWGRGDAVGVRLRAHGARVDVGDSYGQTPLSRAISGHAAAPGGHAAVVTLLLRAGADPNAVDGHGLAPVDYAGRASPAVAELLRAATAAL